MARAAAVLLVVAALAGCGGGAAVTVSSRPADPHVAGRFAAAILRGDAAGARALLDHPDEPALVFLVRRAAAPWRAQHASIRSRARRTGDRWTFSYAGTRTSRDGRFVRERGDLLVDVAGAGVRFFQFAHVRTRFSTHHDAQLLPSNR